MTETAPMAETAPTAFLLTEVQQIGNEVILIGECADYDAYKALPKVLTYQGSKFGLTGWNSDTGRACWKKSAPIASIG